LGLGAAPALATAPKISTFAPVSGPPGTSVLIQGTYLTGATAVAFNGSSASYTVNSATQITTTVPLGASTGPITVTTPGGTAISPNWFTVTAGTPSITLSSASGPPGSKVTVTGSNFAASELVDVYFNTIDMVLASASPSGGFTISFKVPSSAQPGTNWVTAAGRHSGLSAQAAFTVQTDWAQFHNTANRRGHNTTENILNPASVSGIDLDWSFTTAFVVKDSSPAVVSGVVYIGSEDHKLYALDAATGALKWSYTTAGAIDSSPAVANGVVYVGSNDHKVYALDATNGTL
jgi:outer membrane protein assembly factor BamB